MRGPVSRLLGNIDCYAKNLNNGPGVVENGVGCGPNVFQGSVGQHDPMFHFQVCLHAAACAADVCLKERRRLVLLVRETPLHLGHLKSTVAVTEAGGIIMPPVPAFYTRPETVQDIVTQTVSRVLDMFGLDCGTSPRLGGG
jgi:hypothetical protein